MVINYAMIERRCLNMENGSQESKSKSSIWKKVFDFLNTPIVATIVGGLVLAALLNFTSSIRKTIATVAEVPTKLEDIETRLKAVELKVGIRTEDSQSTDGQKTDAAKSPKNADLPKKDEPESPQNGSSAELLAFVVPSAQTESCISDIIYSVSSTQYAAPSHARVTDPIGYVGNTQEECSIEQMAEKKLLLNYMDGKRRVFFYGQFDEDGYWTQNCVINAYEDEKLVLIVDAMYDHGKLLTFEQAFQNEVERRDGQDVWFFSKRAMQEGFSTGETWDYIREGDVIQSFSTDSVTPDDIFTVEKLRKKVGGVLEGYYNGKTSGKLFNDDTYTAYMAKYFDDGALRMLYIGKFVDGFPEDSGNDSWMIVRDSAQDPYSYYKGPFDKGAASIRWGEPNSENHWVIGISQEDIDSLLEGRTFDCELTWAIPSN